MSEIEFATTPELGAEFVGKSSPDNVLVFTPSGFTGPTYYLDGLKLMYRTEDGNAYECPPDIPELDATDGAHPAWWRGHNHTVNVLCQKINEILDGKDNGEGVSSEPWESVRRKLLSAAYLVRRLEKAEKEDYGRRENPN